MKIGILTKSEISEVNLRVINTILQDRKFRIDVAIIDCRPKLSLKEKLLKNIKRGRGGYILIMGLSGLFRKKRNSYKITELCRSGGIGIIETTSPYSSESILRIREYNLDILLLINGYGIIKKDLLEITPLGILSYHHGNMRRYRGMPPAFWELYNNEKEIGITVQKLGIGLDSGFPIVEKSVQIEKKDTVSSLNLRIYDEGVDMMHSALLKLMDPVYEPKRIESLGKVYTLPNLRQWLVLQLKIVLRKCSRQQTVGNRP